MALNPTPQILAADCGHPISSSNPAPTPPTAISTLQIQICKTCQLREDVDEAADVWRHAFTPLFAWKDVANDAWRISKAALADHLVKVKKTDGCSDKDQFLPRGEMARQRAMEHDADVLTEEDEAWEEGLKQEAAEEEAKRKKKAAKGKKRKASAMEAEEDDEDDMVEDIDSETEPSKTKSTLAASKLRPAPLATILKPTTTLSSYFGPKNHVTIAPLAQVQGSDPFPHRTPDQYRKNKYYDYTDKKNYEPKQWATPEDRRLYQDEQDAKVARDARAAAQLAALGEGRRTRLRTSEARSGDR